MELNKHKVKVIRKFKEVEGDSKSSKTWSALKDEARSDKWKEGQIFLAT